MNEKHICCICGKEFTGWSNNSYPVVEDVCICYALTKKQAYKKFSELYASIDMDDIQRVYFWNKGTSILTDY